jgi:hypothetical protein
MSIDDNPLRKVTFQGRLRKSPLTHEVSHLQHLCWRRLCQRIVLLVIPSISCWAKFCGVIGCAGVKVLAKLPPEEALDTTKCHPRLSGPSFSTLPFAFLCSARHAHPEVTSCCARVASRPITSVCPAFPSFALRSRLVGHDIALALLACGCYTLVLSATDATSLAHLDALSRGERHT